MEMNRFALILCTCSKDKTPGTGLTGIRMKAFFRSAFSIITIRQFQYGLPELSSPGSIIDLPLSCEDLSRKSDKKLVKLAEKITRCLSGKDIKVLYLDRHLMKMKSFKNELERRGFLCPEYGYGLLIPLLKDIISEIAGRRKREAGRLEITIVSGEDSRPVAHLLELLAPSFKYLTIAGRADSEMENKLENVLENWGLAIRTTQNIIKAAMDADIIVNFHQSFEYQPGSKQVLINLSKMDTVGEKQLIQPFQLQLEFPENFIHNSDQEKLIDHFTDLGLAEILLRYPDEQELFGELQYGVEKTFHEGGLLDYLGIKRMNMLQNKFSKFSFKWKLGT